MKGGYKNISLQNKNFVMNTPVTIKGIYESIEVSHRKPLLVSDFVYDGVERNDRFVVLGNAGGNYVGSMAIDENINVLKITITPQDAVTLTEN